MPGTVPGSIRGRLLALVAAVAVPLLGVLIWGFVAQLDREHSAARDLALRIARSYASDVRDANERSRALLARMADRPKILAADSNDCDSLFAIVDFFPQYLNLLLYDSSGGLICAATAQPADIGASRAAENQISRYLREGGRPPDELMFLRVDERWISVAFRTTERPGQPDGVLALVQNFDMDVSSFPVGTVLTIVDAEGRVVARSSDGERWVGKNIGDTEIARVAMTGREGLAEARGIDGELRQYGYARIDDSQVFVGIPAGVVMAAVRSLLVRGVIAGSIVLLLVVLLAMKISSTVEQPLQVLASAAQRTADEGYGVRVPTGGPHEIALLARTFNAMIDSRAGAEAALVESQAELQALSTRLLQVQEEERTRIAREIHDELGQMLTALKIDVGGLTGSVDKPTPQQLTMMERIRRALDETFVSVRRIASELRPATLDDFGLVAAIQSGVTAFEERTGIECDLSVPDQPLHLNAESETVVYRIVQEALTNVARHSDATRVEIRLRVRGRHVLVDVRDDGCGLSAARLRDGDALGIVGMRERARRVKGVLEIEGVQGKGTIVSLRLPIDLSEERPV